MALQDIETIVIVIMENRSFDHMLGYLSLDGEVGVEGLKNDAAWQSALQNRYQGRDYPIFRVGPKADPCSDPQHDQQSIAVQISTAPVGPGPTAMGGFVESYVRFSDPVPTDPGAVMGYFDAASLPTFDFFAKNYCVCDRWFASLPLGTQANRLMAMAGYSLLVDNAGVMLPEEDLVYDWLTRNNITWRAYQSGDFLPFFTLMPSWLPEIATSLTLDQLAGGGRFRRYTSLENDWNAQAPTPSVIFIEPEYTDGPNSSPNDDHAPTGIAPGQAFLADIYRTLTSNPARWEKTLLVVTYDEHGGFFDHVVPMDVSTTINGAGIQTTGVRVPAFLISPHVGPGTVFDRPLDHTALLQLLDDRFSPGHGYSDAVNARTAHFDRISNALLDVPTGVPTPKIPTQKAIVPKGATAVPSAPNTRNAQALDRAARKLASEHPELIAQPGWEKLNQYIAATPPR
jgi:phospholipase C